MKEEAKKCPRCGLINPQTAQRCDCGYDFIKGTVETPYFKQRLPKEIKTCLILIIVWNILAAIIAASDNIYNLIWVLIWSVAVYSLYMQLVKKKNWARIVLIVITFPIGLILGLSREAKLYCLQRDE